MKPVNGITRRLFSWIFMILVGTMVLNSALFTHAHILANGTIVVHAHPSSDTGKKAPSAHHSHNSFEFQLIDHLNMLVALFTLLTYLFFLTADWVRSITPSVSVLKEYRRSSRSRAPPFDVEYSGTI